MNLKNKGFTILEILTSIAILGIILAITIPNLASFKRAQIVKNTGEEIVSILNEAQSKTLASLNNDFYSIKFESDKVTLFKGSSFSVGDPNNKVFNFDNSVTLPSGNIVFSDGGSIVTFNKLKGDTIQYGSIKLELVSNSATNKTITIKKTGIISIN